MRILYLLLFVSITLPFFYCGNIKAKNDSSIISITEENIASHLETSKTKLLIIKCYTPWCGPCKQMTPIFKELAKTFPDHIFAQIDVDDEVELADRYNIFSIPTIIFIKDGVVILKISGFQNKIELEQTIKNINTTEAK